MILIDSLCLTSFFLWQAPAAGCMLALACDYRIMYGGHDEGTINGEKQRKHMPAIGFNETQLGM